MLAVLYDVHGNLPALEAVLADAERQGAAEYVLGGDYALFGGWPAETVARLRDLPAARWIRGNGERWTAAAADAPADPVVQEAIAAAREALGPAEVQRLAELPEALSHAGARFVHASPVSDVRSFAPDAATEDDELLVGVQERRLVFGHTHVPFRRVAGGTELVNPGSVGIPLDGDTRAAYALIDRDGTVRHRRVAYDHDAAAAQLPARFGDGAFPRTIAARIRAARFDADPGA